MNIPFYQINSFTKNIFGGNPAGVCLLDYWLEDEEIQAIAKENNYSETAFLVREKELFRIKYFTPKSEVDLCGHATLAAGYVIFKELGLEEIDFQANKDLIKVKKEKDLISLSFPIWQAKKKDFPKELQHHFSTAIDSFQAGDDIYFVFKSSEEVKNYIPNFSLITKYSKRGIVITSIDSKYDFISRAFYPLLDVPEDPVTGSAHCGLVPYWSEKLNKNTLIAKQISDRGGELYCQLEKKHIQISGHCCPYIKGHIINPTIPFI